MLTRTLSLAVGLLAGLTLAGLVSAQARPTAQPDQAAVESRSAPTTQPETAVQRPSLQPAPAGRGSRVSFLLTRNLPPDLRKRHLELWVSVSAEQRRQWRRGLIAILKDTSGRLEEFVARKNKFDALRPEVKARYRHKAELIDQVLDSLTPTEKAKLLSLTAKERAKQIMELVAELKVKQAREATPARPKP